MKEKLTPGIILLACTGILFIAGIFLLEFKTSQQISDYEKQLDAYTQQVSAQKEKLSSASSSYASAIQSQKDLLNWKKQKNSGSRKTVEERLPQSESSNDQTATSVFSQNTSPEYNSFTSDEADTSAESVFSDDSTETTPQESEDLFGDEPAA